MTLPAGTVIAGYRIERVLGAGGMGSVYLAWHPSLHRRDALKLLSAELSHDPQFRARFLREADLAATLDHPNIVTVYDRGQTPSGQLWIAMQFVDGTDAGAQLTAGCMSVPRAVHITVEVAKALDYAHSRKLLHRDVKPANFLLTGPVGDDERVLLADFGIARALDDATGLTGTGMMVATASYAAPETIEGRRVDHRADVYSLACSLFRMLTGRTPYAEYRGMSAILMAHLMQPIPQATQAAPWLPPAIDEVFVHALAKDPDRRFQSAGALAAAAADALGAQQHTAQRQASAPGHAAQTRSWHTPAPTYQSSPPTFHVSRPQHPAPVWPGATPPRSPFPGSPPGWAAPPPTSGRSRRRWGAIVGVATAVIVALVALAVRFFATSTENHKVDNPASSPAAAPPPAVQVASANDTGPVGLITDDPTCFAWQAATEELTADPPLAKWSPDDPNSPINVPATDWTPDQRAAMDRYGRIMRDMAAKAVPLAQSTPHRVMREIYEQYIAYARAFAGSVTNYVPGTDLNVGQAAESLANTLITTCNAVRAGVAANRSVLIAPEAAPPKLAPPQDPDNPHRFVTSTDKTTCGEWVALNDKYQNNPSVQDWNKANDKLPLAQWTPQQKAAADAIAPVILTNADDNVRIAGRGNNAVIQDFAAFAAGYQRAFVKALPSYGGANDAQLGFVGHSLRLAITDACHAAGG